MAQVSKSASPAFGLRYRSLAASLGQAPHKPQGCKTRMRMGVGVGAAG